jgi:hypothetical protein
MHKNSMAMMSDIVERHLAGAVNVRILDVGSRDVNGTYKKVFSRPTWEYVGMDIETGRNVDIVADGEWSQIPDGSYGVVVSGQCLEHVKMPWIWSKQLFRVCKPGGICIVIAPWSFKEHRHPVDCWRVLPDGMVSLMSEWTGFETMEVFKKECDTCFVGRKP